MELVQALLKIVYLDGWILITNDENGVAYAIEKYILEEVII